MNRESERIPYSLTSTSSIRPEPFGSELKANLLMAEGSRVAAGIFNWTVFSRKHNHFLLGSLPSVNRLGAVTHIRMPLCGSEQAKRDLGNSPVRFHPTPIYYGEHDIVRTLTGLCTT